MTWCGLTACPRFDLDLVMCTFIHSSRHRLEKQCAYLVSQCLMALIRRSASSASRAHQAILDSYCLAAQLKQLGAIHATPKEALREYRRQRWLPTARLLLNSRILGFLETQRGFGADFRDFFFLSMGACLSVELNVLEVLPSVMHVFL